MIISSMKLSIKILPMSLEKIRPDVGLVVLLVFENYPKKFIQRKLVKKLFKFMEKKGMKFFKCTICVEESEAFCISVASPDYAKSLNHILFDLSDQFCLEAHIADIFAPPPPALTSSIYRLMCSTFDFSFWGNLKSITFKIDSIFTEFTLSNLHSIYRDLLKLEHVEMEYLTLWDEYEPGFSFKSICLQFADIFKKRPEVDFKFIRVDHYMTEMEKIEDNCYFDLFKDLSPIYKYFESIGLPFDDKIIQYCNRLNVSKLYLEDDPHKIHLNDTERRPLFLQNSHLEELKLSWASLTSPMMMSLKGLTRLTCLEMVDCLFDGKVFGTFPDSLRIIHLKRCFVSGVLNIPTSLRLLKLNKSYPIFSIAEPSPMVPKLVLKVKLIEANEREIKNFTDTIEQISCITKEVHFKGDLSRPSFVILTRNPLCPPIGNQTPFAQFSLQFLETIRASEKFLRFEKMCYINIFHFDSAVTAKTDFLYDEESSIFTQLCQCCMQTFQFGKPGNRSFRRISGENPVFEREDGSVSFEVQLCNTFERNKLPFIAKVNVIESKYLLPTGN
ncbi:unnamed protein product [Ambrosiozyma monospora]|uniref:Unnamed protein product n=1 Tax=Ambrosiozyma monospora TaxID=43982 RepID=A0A9W7DEP2_AMBMO|nr:unnamed protein product [Ambrosiozyma monospora]